MNKKLSRDFFAQDTLTVAQQLIGKALVFNNVKGIITETEGYIGQDDPACHAARGRTKRTEVMFGPPGFSYVYMIYGMYFCFNIVTEQEGFPAAVLIRGVKFSDSFMDGPGKVCRKLSITTQHNNVDMVKSEHFYVLDKHLTLSYRATPRIGISQGREKLWRFKLYS